MTRHHLSSQAFRQNLAGARAWKTDYASSMGIHYSPADNFATFSRFCLEMLMKKSIVATTLVLGAVLCSAPFSIQRTAGSNLSMRTDTAAAAELAIPARRSVSRHVRYAGYYR